MDGVSAVASVSGVIEVIRKIRALLVHYSSAVKNANSDISRLTNELDGFEGLLKEAEQTCSRSDRWSLAKPEGDLRTIRDLAIHYCRILLSALYERLRPEKTSRPTASPKLREFKWPLERKEVDYIIETLERYKGPISFAFQIDQCQRIGDIGKLPVASLAPFESYSNYREPRCYEHTRVDLLQNIREWVMDSDGPCIYWLHGMAGTGKSTISRTIAHEYKTHQYKNHQLAASFFFKRGEGDRGNSSRFFTTIARQLIQNVPETKYKIVEAISTGAAIASKNFGEQFDKLLLQPLSMAIGEASIDTLLLIVDALDECEDEVHVKLIIQLLSQVQTLQSGKVKILITSRSEAFIRLAFKDISQDAYTELILHKVPDSIIKDDIFEFFKCSLEDIRKDRGLAADWPGDANLESLTEISRPLFISAATICRFIGDKNWDPQEQLETVLLRRHMSHIDEFTKIYQPVLDQSLRNQSSSQQEKLLNEFQTIVGAILVLEDSLSANSLSSLIKIPRDTIERRLFTLHSVLKVPSDPDEPIQVLHQSFVEFLTSGEHKNNPFAIDERKMQKIIAQCCLDLIRCTDRLKEDICSYNNPSIHREDVDEDLIDSYLPPEVRYACINLTKHIVKAKEDLSIYEGFHDFLHERFLFWIEALCWKGHSYSISGMLDDLLKLVRLSPSSNDLLEFLRDAKSFIGPIQGLLNVRPLQIYSSGLLFSPKTNSIRQAYESSIPGWTEGLSKVEECWEEHSRGVSPGHTDLITCTALSRNGKWLASGSLDHTVKLWDANSENLLHTLSGHLDIIKQVAFHPNEHDLITSSRDGTIKIWNITSGFPLATLSRSPGTSMDMTVAADGKHLASHTYNESVILWDMTVAADGKHLVSHTYNESVILWDMHTLTPKKSWKGLPRPMPIEFAPSGDLFALADYPDEFTICLFDTEGTRIHRLECISDDRAEIHCTTSVAFSPNGVLLAANSSDGFIFLHHTRTGLLQHVLEVYGGPALFSPDGLHLACASLQGGIQLWEPTNVAKVQNLQINNEPEQVKAFSPTGKYLASVSGCRSINLWHLPTRTCKQIFQSASYDAQPDEILFAPDDQALFFSAGQRSIYRWDITSSTLCCKVQNCHSIKQVLFSPCGKLLASYIKEADAIRVWNTENRAALHTLKYETSFDVELSFSPDSKHLISTHSEPIYKTYSDPKYKICTKIWDVVKGASLWTYSTIGVDRGGDSPSFIMSPDGQHLVARFFEPRSIQVFTVAAGRQRFLVEAGEQVTEPLTFSPDGKRIAIGLCSDSITIQDVATGGILQTLQQQGDEIAMLEFSPDGKYLASLSKSGIINLWNLHSDYSKKIIMPHEAGSVAHGVIFSPDSKLLLSHGNGGITTIVEVINDTSRHVIDNTRRPMKYAFSSDSKKIVKYGVELSFLKPKNLMILDAEFDAPPQTIDINTYVSRLSFTADYSYLETDHGLISLKIKDEMTTDIPPGEGLFFSDYWIFSGGERLLWLPPSFRPTAQDYRNGRHALGFGSGRIMLYDPRLDPSERTMILL